MQRTSVNALLKNILHTAQEYAKILYSINKNKSFKWIQTTKNYISVSDFYCFKFIVSLNCEKDD